MSQIMFNEDICLCLYRNKNKKNLYEKGKYRQIVFKKILFNILRNFLYFIESKHKNMILVYLNMIIFLYIED